MGGVVEPLRVMVIVCILLLSGCAGKGGDPVQQTPGVVIGDGDVVVAPDRGAVQGTVRSDQGTPLPDARVQLVGTAMFLQTGLDGRFLFVNVTPPEVVLRVEAQGFRVWEAPVAVQAQKVSSVNVTMLPELGLDPDARQHEHDMWRGQGEITVLDGSFPLTPFDPEDPRTWATASSTVTWANINRPASYNAPILLPDEAPDDDLPAGWPALIYPGTQRIEVTVSWDMEDSNIDSLALRYHNATTTDWQMLDLKPSGGTWTIEIDDPFETDRGHQVFSLWGFAVNALNDAEGAPGGYRGPAYFLGDIDVQMTVFKGPFVPLEPAHPDFWQGNASMLVRSGDDAHAPNLAVTDTYRDPADLGQHDINLRGAIVPPGTTRMRLDFSWKYPTGDGLVDHPEWALTWRAADAHPATTPLSAYGRADPIEGSQADQRLVYEFDVLPEQADAYYQQNSRWSFLISAAGFEDETFYPQWFRWRGTAPPEFYLEVTVFKEG